MYLGQFNDDKGHGQGAVISANGDKYVGHFKNGAPHGEGIATREDGVTIVGRFKSSRPWVAVEYDREGKLIATYEDGVRSE